MLFIFNCKIRVILFDDYKMFLCMLIILLKLYKKINVILIYFGYFNWKLLYFFNDIIIVDLYFLILYGVLIDLI